MVDGLTNPQIGAKLFMSRGTVKAHFSHVVAKLGLANRTDWQRSPPRAFCGTSSGAGALCDQPDAIDRCPHVTSCDRLDG